MPNLNGQGPRWGGGTGAGWGMGPCNGFARGFGRGMCMGYARGYGRQAGMYQRTPAEYKSYLDNEEKALEEELALIREEKKNLK